MFVLQNTSNFSLVKSGAGEVVTEDGRSRCPFNPEYKSTAIVAGRSQGASAKLVRVEVGLCVTDVQVILVNRRRPMTGRQNCSVTSGFWVPLHDAAARSLARSLVFTLLVMLVLQTGSCMLVQSVISKGMNPLFTRLSARELL